MKPFFAVVLLLCYTVCFAQEIKKAASFKAITYNTDGTIWNTRVELINTINASYDLYFISKNFYSIPLPASFASDTYKSQKIETTTGANKTKRVQNLVYDEFGRVASYGISGCVVCNDLGYQYDVHYNLNNQVDTLKGALGSLSASRKYIVHYEPNGDVKQIDYSISGKLSVQILLF